MIIDISYYNKVVSWEEVKKRVDGVIIRMGYTGYSSGKCVLDKKWREYSTAALAAGIPRGAYFFPQSINKEEAQREADFIYNELKDVSLPLGIWLDSEIADVKTKNGRADHLSKATRTEMLKIIIDRLKSYGLTCGVYASSGWLDNNLNMKMLSGVPVWAAQWSNKLTYKGSVMLWQYSDNGTIPGISGRVDLDRLINNEETQSDPVTDQELDAAIDVIALRVIVGKFGQGHEARKNSIYELIRKRVNDII